MKKLVMIALTGMLLGILGCSKLEKNPPTDDVLKPFKHKKGRTVHPELTQQLMAGLKDDELEQAVFENMQHNMKADTRTELEKVKELTIGQRAVYVTWVIEEEVYNGGLDRFYNRPSNVLSDMAEEAFTTIGAPKFAELMKDANALYKGTGTSKPSKEAFENIDDQFYNLYDTENLDVIKVKYIRAHPEEFVKQTPQ